MSVISYAAGQESHRAAGNVRVAKIDSRTTSSAGAAAPAVAGNE